MTATDTVKRILIVDDNPSIHEDLKTVLRSNRSSAIDAETSVLEDELFGDDGIGRAEPLFAVDYVIDNAFQGEEAVRMVEVAEREGLPYSLIFMDVRMPPGMDGIRTTHNIWNRYPNIEVVICTAYSDYSWDEIVRILGPKDCLLFLKKPFDSIEVRQLAFSLTSKWEKARGNRADTEKFKDEIRKRTRELKDMMAGLEALKIKTESLILSKNKLLTSIRYGIQTPLSGIMGVNDMLLDTDLDQDQRNLAETIKTSGDSLLVVLDDIIKFSNTNADNYVADEIEFNLRTAIAKVADLISACAWEKGLETSTIVHADVPGTLTGDPLRLRQILLILAVNAITFTRAGEIAISVQRDLSEEALAQTKKDPTKVYLRFEVSDTGDGLSPERRQYLASVRTTKKPPQNDEDMGMVLFRRQVDLLGGETGIESEQGLGSTFWFTARFSVKDAPEYHMLPEAASINGIRCLIVGDNPTSRKVLSLYINQWGGYCSEASSAAGAVEQLQTALDIKCFDVAMVNFKSEALDQYKAVAAAIRHHRNLDTLSLICITSMAKKGDAKLLSNYGYSAYLTKPIKPGHLYNSLLMIREFQEDPTPIKSEPIITKHLLDEISRDRYRILVVEDNPKNTKVVVGLLNRLTIMCDVAASGKEAMEAFSNKNYDMIIIGCRLPDMDGYQASRAIRQLERQAQREGTAAKAHIPILALTADAQAEDRDRCLASGMDDLITEPVHFDKMRAMIKNYLD